MRKGFDWMLAWALKTSHEMLFKDWVNTAPDKAREFIFKRPEGRPPPDPGYFEKATDRQLLEEFITGTLFPNLTDEQLERLAGLALVDLAQKPVIGHLLPRLDHPYLQRLQKLFELLAQAPDPYKEIAEKGRRTNSHPL